MGKKIKDLLSYGGLEEEQYNSLALYIAEANKTSLFVYSAITCIIMTLLSMVSLVVGDFAAVNLPMYAISAVLSFICLAISKLIQSNRTIIIMLSMYLFQTILYWFSMSLIKLHPDKPSVSAIVFMVIIPLLFVDRPGKHMSFTLIVVIVFCILSLKYKGPELGTMEVWNGIAFGMVAILIGIIICSVRIKSLYQNKTIEEFGRIDLLTGLNNRNCFEQDKSFYEGIKDKNIFCIFGDVNGLHEMNNSKGHAAGDEMLKFVAAEFKKQFGRTNTYRIGGDEFVACIVDGEETNIRDRINLLTSTCCLQGYYVSVGYAVLDGDELDMEELLRLAEESMYYEKSQFYNDNKIERRRSRS